mmetsp:Transcript_74090/g.176476  ORF Transcript_74090/g.176476 Transcript_74090/m.176476 type:complete len:283 (-) Transcript_74090:63-911(-)
MLGYQVHHHHVAESRSVRVPGCVARRAERRRRCSDFLSTDIAGSRAAGGPVGEIDAVHRGGSSGSKDTRRQLSEGMALASLGASVPLDRASLVQMACLPLLPGMAPQQEAERYRIEFSERARTLMHILSGTCLVQASVATMEFALQDSISGMIGCCLAGFGLQAATPGGHRFLPSFIVLSFCNGTMQVLLSAETLSALPKWHLAKLSALKLATATSIASPALIFAGLFAAWRLHNELRRSSSATASSLPSTQVESSAAGEGSAPIAAFQPFSGEHHRLDPPK